MTKLQSIKSWAVSQARRGNTAKGDAFEAEIVRDLEAEGWVVDRTKMNRRMIVRRGRSAWITTKADFFGCIDLIAFRPQLSPILLIQATDGGDVRAKMREIDAKFVGQASGRVLAIVTKQKPVLANTKVPVGLMPECSMRDDVIFNASKYRVWTREFNGWFERSWKDLLFS